MSRVPQSTPFAGFWIYAAAVLAGFFALAAPWSIAGAQGAVVVGMGLLLVGALLRRVEIPPLPWTFAAILLFLTLQALSIPLGVHPARSLQAFGGSWVLLFPLVFWVLLAQPRTRRWALRLLVVSGGLAGVYGLLQHLSGQDPIKEVALETVRGGGYMAIGTLGHHLTYAGVLLPLFFLAIGLLLDERRRWPWILAGVGIALGLATSFARTIWIALVAGLLVLGLLRGRRALLITLGGLAVAGAAAFLLIPAVQERVLSILTIGERPRMRLWLTALHMARDHPWLGGGLGCFGTLFADYRVAGEYLSTAHPHNDYLNILVETGLPGLLAWLGIWVAFFRETALPRGRRAWGRWGGERGRWGPDRPLPSRGEAGRPLTPATRPWLPDALRAGVAAVLVAGLGQCYATSETVAQVWWFIVVAALLEADRPVAPQESLVRGVSGNAG